VVTEVAARRANFAVLLAAETVYEQHRAAAYVVVDAVVSSDFDADVVAAKAAVLDHDEAL